MVETPVRDFALDMLENWRSRLRQLIVKCADKKALKHIQIAEGEDFCRDVSSIKSSTFSTWIDKRTYESSQTYSGYI